MTDRLPTGVVTFLFTDIEGSTTLVRELHERYGEVLADQRRILRGVWERWRGAERSTEGDSFFVVFRSPLDAVRAAEEAQRLLAEHAWPHGKPLRVRMGMHTGEPSVVDEDYFGIDVNIAARIAGSGHGGQVVLSQATRALVAGEDMTLTDLGEHRLKDLDAPIRIFQLGGEPFPPLKTISNTNVPRPASAFVGRQREVAEVRALFAGGARIVTLTGPGGSGKTRLAIEVATELIPAFKAGVFWVSLAALRDPTLVVDEIAKTLGAKDEPAAHIGEREMLLLLDNLEQVIDAAHDISTLARACANLRLLVTSRELLRIDGEVEYPVRPLDAEEAVALFSRRSGLEPDPDIEELCRRLDDLPLAIELAAARTAILSPADILARLSARLDLLKAGRDADPRQATLRATIEWSHELLSPGERALFARLSVFAGGCTLQSAEEVAGADLDTLQALLDKSLVRRTGDRFWMLETIREYAVEQLKGMGEADPAADRHARAMLRLAEEGEPFVRAEMLRRPGPWLHRFEREHDNFRAALDRFEYASATEEALRLAGALWWFWQQFGHVTEGRARLEAALRAGQAPDDDVRAKALVGCAMMTAADGETEAGKRLAEMALTLWREIGDAWGIADAAATLGYLLGEEQDMDRARPLFEESVRLLEELGDTDYALWLTRSLGWTYHDQGDYARAREIHQRNLERARAAGNASVEATTLAVLATIALDERDVDAAIPFLVEAYRTHRDIGEPSEAATDLCRLAMALALSGKPAPAVRVLACWDALTDAPGSKTPWVLRMNERTLQLVREHLDDAEIEAEQARGCTLSPDDAFALALRGLGAGT